jgi:transmembrane sensor
MLRMNGFYFFLKKKRVEKRNWCLFQLQNSIAFMDHYKNYSTEDFIQDMRFRSWVRNPSREEDVIWKSWITENNYKREVIEEARAIILSVHPVHKDTISDGEIQKEIDNILASISEEQVRRPVRKNGISFSFWVKIAASISIVLIAGWYGIRSSVLKDTLVGDNSVVSSDNYMIERVNKSADTLLINLPDNSSVLLSQNSLIRYPRQFTGDTRDVFLKGTAFFEVTKDLHKPFHVNAGRIVAKVLGTSFEISTNPVNEQIRVVVKSGTVSIYSNPEQDTDTHLNVILTQNEQFIFKNDVSQIQHTRLDSSSIEELKIPDTYLKFKGTPAEEVFKSLAKVYEVKINYENAQISGCSVTASFTDEPFALKLDLICRSIGVTCYMVNDHVTITGNGCRN